jgi:5-methylcytosine-specific restriction protein A
MGERFQRRCNEPGCTTRTADRSGYCPKHVADNTRKRQRALYDAERHKDPISKGYNVIWDRIKTMLRNRGNVICQRIVDGQQCRMPVEIFHHLISPRENPALMYDWQNIVGVCRQHHPPTEGEPKENLPRLAEIYVPTIWCDPVVG